MPRLAHLAVITILFVLGGCGPVTTVRPTATAGGSVLVTVTVTGAPGSRAAVLLYQGLPWFAGGDGQLIGLGGFSADVASDRFTLSGWILEGPPKERPWPDFTGRSIARVPPGIHTLAVWVSKSLTPFSRWMPAPPLDQACAAHPTVAAGQRTDVILAVSPSVPEATPGGDRILGIQVCARSK